MRSIRALALLATMTATALLAQTSASPVAKKIPQTSLLHGETRVDEYAYFRDRNNPETIPYLERENAYTDAMTAHTAALQERIYEEIVGRIREDDSGVPAPRDGWFYYSRTEKGKQYPIYARKRGSLAAAEEIYFDQNVEAAEFEFYQLGGMEVSPDHQRLAVLVDTNGYEDFVLRVKDLRTGQWLADRIEKLSWGLAWADDNATLFYMTPDSAKRGDKVWRHTVGAAREQDELVYHEPDVLFNASVQRARSGAWILIGSGSFTSSEWRVIPSAMPAATPRVLAPRRAGIVYEVEAGSGYFYIVTNEQAQNFKVMRAPFDAAGPAEWSEWLAHDPAVFIEGVMALKEHVVVQQRRDGLRRIRVTDLALLGPQATHEIEFPEAAYGVSLGGNSEFVTKTLRFTYSSMITPNSVYDYALDTRVRDLKKRDDVLGGYDPAQYEVERVYATARDGTRVPVSMVYKKGLRRDGSRPLLLYAYGSYCAES